MKEHGFTLVEVLVALVIVAAGASAVLSSLNTAATSTVYLRDKTFAEWIANNRIVETRLATSAPQNGKSEGELDYAGRRWQWRQQVTEGALPGLRRIDVSVRPAGEARAVAAADDWTLTISGVLGRDVAPPGAGLDWEPAAPGPAAAGAGTGSGNANAGGANGNAGDPGSSGTPSPGSSARPGVTEGPRT